MLVGNLTQLNVSSQFAPRVKHSGKIDSYPFFRVHVCCYEKKIKIGKRICGFASVF